MKFSKKKSVEDVKIDMTPMIDMVFQLIIFFMLLINFDQGEQNEKIKLPNSSLARPPDAPLEFPITLHVTAEGNAIYGGQEMAVANLHPYLKREREVIEMRNDKDATIIIRAHKDAVTGKVQEVIKVCQEQKAGGFEKFVLRVKEEGAN